MWLWVALFFSIGLGAFGQIFMKIGMKSAGAVPMDEGIAELILYFYHALFSLPLFGAFLCYGLSFVLWLGVLSMADLSLARPLMSVGYLITMAYGYHAGEDVGAERVLGTLLIVIGLFFVARSGVSDGGM